VENSTLQGFIFHVLGSFSLEGWILS